LALHSGMPPVIASGFSILLPSNHVAGRSQFAEEEEKRVIDDCIIILWLLEFVSPILKDLVRGFVFEKKSLTTRFVSLWKDPQP